MKPLTTIKLQETADRRFERTDGLRHQIRVAQRAPRLGEGSDGQRVPTEDRLEVGARLLAQRPRLQQLVTHAVKARPLDLRWNLGKKQHIGRGGVAMVRVLKVGAVIKSKHALRPRGVVGCKHGAHFLSGPEKVEPFLSVDFCVKGRVKQAVGAQHLATHPPERTARRPRQPRIQQRIQQRIARRGHQRDELRRVIEHLLKVRHAPNAIDRVTMKPTTEMIVHSAQRNRAQRPRQRVARAGHLTGKRMHQFEPCWLGKLRRAAKAAVLLVFVLLQRQSGARSDLVERHLGIAGG